MTRLARACPRLVDLALVAAVVLLAGSALGGEPRFQVYNPPGAVDDRGILTDITSRLSHLRRQQSYESDPIGWAHEGTHYLNVQLDDWCGPDGTGKEEHCAYVGGGRFILLRHPHVTLEAVRRYISPRLQGAFESTVCSWRQYNTEPLYLLDEWTAYANGSQACRELRADATRTRGSDERAQWLGHFCDALVAAVRAYDPGYPQLSDLAAFVEWHKLRVAGILGLAVAAEARPSPQCRWVWDGRQWAKVCETRPVALPAAPAADRAVAGADRAEADARGWTAANVAQPPQAPESNLASPVYIVPMYGRHWHEDVAQRVEALESDRRPAADLRPMIAEQTKSITASLAQLPGQITAAVQTAADGLRNHLAASATSQRRPTAWEFAAQVLLVASGSGLVLGGSYGAWRLAAWGCGRVLRAAVRRHLAEIAPAATPAGLGGPAAEKHFRRPGAVGGRTGGAAAAAPDAAEHGADGARFSAVPRHGVCAV